MNVTTNSSSLDRRLAYSIFRFTFGINILIHGIVRLSGSGARTFAAKTAGEFTGTPLPQGLVHAFLTVLPFAEAILGLCLTLGLLTRWALAVGGTLMVALTFGTALRSDWTTVGIQMIYSITYYLLLANMAENYFSLDILLGKLRKS